MKQAPPEHLKVTEIERIAVEISRRWKTVAHLTNKFDKPEIYNLSCSRVNEDKKDKAREMLSMYCDRRGTRQKLAKVLEEIDLVLLSQKVRSGDFIDDEDD